MKLTALAGLLAGALVLMAPGCSGGPTEPPLAGPPSGTTPVSVALSRRPYGLAAVGNAALVTRLDYDSVSRVGAESTPLLAGSFATGSIPTGIAASADGARVLVAAQGDRSVTLHDRNGSILTRFTMAGTPFRTAISRDGRRGYAVSSTGSLLVLDLDARVPITEVATGLVSSNGLALSPGDTALYVSGTSGGGIAAVSLRTNTVTRTYPLTGSLQEVVVSPDGQELYVADEWGRLHALALRTGAERVLALPDAFGMAMTGDGSQLWITRSLGGLVSIVDRASFTLLKSFRLREPGLTTTPRRIAFDGSTAVISDESGFVHVIH